MPQWQVKTQIWQVAAAACDAASTAVANSKQRHEKEDAKMSELQKRRVEVGNLLGKAVSIESRLTEILIALDQCDPANYDIPWRDNFCE